MRKLEDVRSGTLKVYAEPEISDLIPEFLESQAQDLERMLGSLREGDFEAIRVLSHSMKGAGAGYGFEALTEIAVAVERCAKQDDASGVAEWAAVLADYLERVEVVYE